ncbi:Aste57867_13101 [Aphanomyces stellatus]|uniref:Aste57867_13101 protein n=1 Tax=Aphanomyces stellatus TaxID=120398 RepID=A0A485KY58_9STRA|nr:hypothetical protein As57867_013053 [Aphanomyces stellatus]VFT89945.1 Aste57867_13101 [Aphanomyces stellatus]
MAAVTEGYAPSAMPKEERVPTIVPKDEAREVSDGADLSGSDAEPDKEQDGGDDTNDENTAPDDGPTNGDRKPRRELPPATVQILKNWMLSPEHVKHPYPTDDDKKMLLEKTGINMKQLTNWFTNARKRIWKPMMRREHSRQLQTSTFSAPGAPPGSVDTRSPPPPPHHHHPSSHHHHPAHPHGAAPPSHYDHGYDHGPYEHAAPPGYPSGAAPLTERRLSLPRASEFTPRHDPRAAHPYGPPSSMGHHHHHHAPPPSHHSQLPPGHSPYPFEHGASRMPQGFFPPRSNRSASESVVYHHSTHHHHPHHMPHPSESRGYPPSDLPRSTASSYGMAPLMPPPRLERSMSDVAKSKKRDRPSVDATTTDDEKDVPPGDGPDKRVRRSALLPPHVIKTLKDWMMSPEHMEHPYPTDAEKKQLCEETGLDLSQLNNWFANNRKRLWKPTMANRSKAMYTNESIRNIIYKAAAPGDAAADGAAPATTTTVASTISNRVFTVNANLGRPAQAPPPSGLPLPPSSSSAQGHHGVFPSLAALPPREGRSHTLDMGSFRRSRMNFQDVLNASTTALPTMLRRQESGGGGLPSLAGAAAAVARGEVLP